MPLINSFLVFTTICTIKIGMNLKRVIWEYIIYKFMPLVIAHQIVLDVSQAQITNPFALNVSLINGSNK